MASIDRKIRAVEVSSSASIIFVILSTLKSKHKLNHLLMYNIVLVIGLIYCLFNGSSEPLNYSVFLVIYLLFLNNIDDFRKDITRINFLNMTIIVSASIFFAELYWNSNHGSNFGYFSEGNVVTIYLVVFWWATTSDASTARLYKFLSTVITILVLIFTGAKLGLLITAAVTLCRMNLVTSLLTAFILVMVYMTTGFTSILRLIFVDFSIVKNRLDVGVGLLDAILSGRLHRMDGSLREFNSQSLFTLLFGDLSSSSDKIKYIEVEPANLFFDLGLITGSLFFVIFSFHLVRYFPRLALDRLFIILLLFGIFATGHYFQRPFAASSIPLVLSVAERNYRKKFESA